MKRPASEARTKRAAIIEIWRQRGQPYVGEELLRAVQKAISERFGEGAVDSPAAIARVLANEDALLRHPEVIEFDAKWREAKIRELSSRRTPGARDPGKPQTLKSAAAALRQLEKLRRRFSAANNQTELRHLRELAINEKARAQLLARDDVLGEQTRSVQAEIAEWFRVWLQTPELFADWLELRQRSPDFRRKFPE